MPELSGKRNRFGPPPQRESAIGFERQGWSTCREAACITSEKVNCPGSTPDPGDGALHEGRLLRGGFILAMFIDKPWV
jgi:hypothetical protein